MKVLVVDDEPDILETTAMMLEHRGHETVTTSDWRRVTDLLATGRFDVVLQDVRMPGLDIVEFVPQMRAAADVQIVLFTANRILDPDAAALDVDGLLAKPFAASALFLAIEEPREHQDGVHHVNG